MFQPFTSTPETKPVAKHPHFLNEKQPDSSYHKDFCKNNFTRYSEMSDSGHNSFFTPGTSATKKAAILDDITNILNNVNAKKLEFSASLDTASSKGQTPNYIIKKFDIETSLPMDVEDIEMMDNSLDSEKHDDSIYGSTIMDGLIQTSMSDTWRKGQVKNDSNSQEGSRMKNKDHSLINRWKKNDKIFQGKYSTGATPKYTKNTPRTQDRLSLIPFKRCNTDVPPTFEADKLLMTGEKSEIGANKYINNLITSAETKKLPDLSFKGINPLFNNTLPKPLPAAIKPKNFPQVTNKPPSVLKSKVLKDGPFDFSQPKINTMPDSGLFLIPERSLECDLVSLFSKANNSQQHKDGNSIREPKKDSVTKFLTFDEEEDDNINREEQDKHKETEDIEPIRNVDNIEDEKMALPLHTSRKMDNNIHVSPQPKKGYNTPTKKNSPFTDVKFNFFNTVTAKKEPQSKIFHKTRPFDLFGSQESIREPVVETKEYLQPTRSRFEQDYEVLEVLGSGYFGTVYKCQNKLDGLIYAIKCTRNKLKGKSNINQALNEAQALASLSVLDENPFIVRYYSAWIEDDRLYLAMEHCQRNLKALRHQHIRFSESMIRQIMRDVCMGLRHLHNQKIVHLDIKPENILYSKTKKYKIADLGLSRIAQRSNNEDINEGDCRYLAPELLKDYPDHELPDLTKADIFSFGATIYELMIGTDLPKNGKEWINLRDGNLVKLDQLNYSNSLKSMLRAMMSSNPDFRPSAHELLTHYLQSEIELELKWEKKQNKILKERVKELEEKLRAKRKNSL